MSLLSDPEFESALGLAKALALYHQCAQLTPRLLLAGMYLAACCTEETEGGNPSVSSAELKAAVADLVAGEAEGLAPVRERKLPLDGSLKRILRTPPNTLKELATALLGVLEIDEAEEALLLLFRRRASSKCAVSGRTEIAAGEFAVAAYVSYLAGDLLDRPALSVHLASNQRAVHALMAANGWDAAHFPPCETPPLPFDKPLVGKMREAAKDGRRLFAAINAGIGIGAELLRREETAVHEAGHAVTLFLLRPQVPIARVTIVRQGDADGTTSWDPSAPYLRRSETSRHYSEELCIALAGGIAQQIKYGPEMLDEGSRSDLDGATRTAWQAVARFGLDKEIGPISMPALAEVSGQSAGPVFGRVQERVQELLKESATRVESLLRENWSLVERVAAALVDREVLGTEDLMLLFIDRGLAQWPGVRKVRSVMMDREIRFATEPGVMETREGPVRYAVGDALVTGSGGECWPVDRAKFEGLYAPLEGGEMGVDGTFRKLSGDALAFQLKESRPVPLSSGRGILYGNAGDWIVDYGLGDLAAISAAAFDSYYVSEFGK